MAGRLLQAVKQRWHAQLTAPVNAWTRGCTTTAVDVPVVIVGAGPTGLTLSKLLSQLGVQSLVVERASSVTSHPQAHFINNRTMEIFRHIYGMPDGRSLAADVAAASPPLHEWRKFIYCESATGSILGDVDHFKGQAGPRMHDISPEPVAHLSQHRLLPMLLACALENAVNSRVLFDRTALEINQPADHVSIVMRTSKGKTETVHCKYVVAADGANSRVRGMLGIPLQGQSDMQHLVNIHFIAPQLKSSLRGREAMLYFVFNPSVIAVLVAHDISSGEFVAQVPYFPPAQSLADFTPTVLKTLLVAAIGQPEISLDVKSIRTWSMHAEVADIFQAGNVFLAGDAAHRFPPAGGFGMNTGIQDAHNLAWKLAAVLQGRADSSLLGSYERERKPVALANTALSVSNWQQALKVPAALGLDPRAAKLLQAAVASRPASLLPPGLVRSALDVSLSLGRAAAGVRGPLKAWRRKALQSIFEAGNSLRLQFPLEDLGFCYTAPGSAVCLPGQAASSRAPAALDAASDTAQQNVSAQQGRGLDYVQNTQPGSRLPHLELKLLASKRHSDGRVTQLSHTESSQVEPQGLHADSPAGAGTVRRGAVGKSMDQQFTSLSTHDLLDAGSTSLLMLLGQGRAAAVWAAAARRVDPRLQTFNIVQIFDGPYCRESLRAETVVQDAYVRTAQDVSSRWKTLRQVSENGAILVRPDGHISWRADMRQGADGYCAEDSTRAAEHLRTALAALQYVHEN